MYISPNDIFASLAAEVLQKLKFERPAPMGSNIYFDSHAAWESKTSFCDTSNEIRRPNKE